MARCACRKVAGVRKSLRARAREWGAGPGGGIALMGRPLRWGVLNYPHLPPAAGRRLHQCEGVGGPAPGRSAAIPTLYHPATLSFIRLR